MPDKLPSWVAEEISNSKWKATDTFKGSGYFLMMNSKEKNADIQFYEPLPDGRHIVTADVPESIKVDGYERGEVYLFNLQIYKSDLSDKVKQFLEEQYKMNMEIIHKYELTSVEKLNE
tara:strand:+ start:194 stop:547 length:354 start_codon:yes stop_codon:yes gene_type:complete